jgi:hypothetical protein
VRALVAGALALLAGACGSSPSKTSDTTASNSTSPRSLAAAVYKHAACMRDHGVPNFPEPQVSTTPSSVRVRQMVPGSLAASPQFKAAQKACQGILPDPSNASPAQQAAEQHARTQYLLAFARCLRSHGVANFPDPTGQGQLTLDMIRAAGVDLHAPGFLTAAKACVGVTHGAITPAQVLQAVNGTH